jgi:hypothetical protein
MNLDDDENFHNEEILNVDLYNLVASVIAVFLSIRDEPIPENTCPLSGNLYYRYLMDSASDAAFFDVARMHKVISFIPLLHLLQHSGGLQNGNSICAGEKIFIFIHILCGNSMRDTKSRWQHSTSTISVLFHEVIDSFMNIRDIVFEKPKVTTHRRTL